MNKIAKTLSFFALIIIALASFVSCSDADTPYDSNDEEGYTVTVRYDANGGMFSTGTEVIADSYDLNDVTQNKNNKICLVAPNDSVRGQANTFSATRAGYFLAGWYTERAVNTGENGEELYSYSGRWDFKADRLTVDPDKNYSASEPAITLYAAWIPEFSFNFYDLDTGELLEKYKFDPNFIKEIELPYWNDKTGEIKMNKFPSLRGKTFDKAYLDSEGREEISSLTVAHTGLYDPETATANNTEMNIYLDYLDGEWFKIFTAEQFIDHSAVNGNYIIAADLDFSGLKWKGTLAQGTFRGTIIGNGYSFRNISYTQSTLSLNTGIFGKIDDAASITNLKIENAELVIKAGSKSQDTNFGLFAGNISAGAELDGITVSGRITLDPDVIFLNSINLGLVCGTGYVDQIDFDAITFAYEGDSYVLTQNGNAVTVS